MDCDVAVFGMNVGGVPWTGQKDPTSEDGFRNVLLICAAILFLFLAFFGAVPLYMRLSAWRKRIMDKRIWPSTGRSFSKRGNYSGDTYSGGYLFL